MKSSRTTTTTTRRSKRVKNNDETEDLDTYISHCRLSENNPGLLFDWNADVIEAFVDTANKLEVQPPMKQPHWLTSDNGHMSALSFQNDVITNLSSVGGGGSCENVFLAPNTIEQYSSILMRLKEIEVDPFIQAVMNNGARGVLADTFVVTSKNSAGRKRLSIRVPDAQYVQVFR